MWWAPVRTPAHQQQRLQLRVLGLEQRGLTAGPLGEGHSRLLLLPPAADLRMRSHGFVLPAVPGVNPLLLPPYPGKLVPMYRLQYRPGCWPLRLRITPPIHFLARFEFMFHDALGEDEKEIAQREKDWAILSLVAINVTQKTLCAAVYGLFGLRARSPLQLGALLALQTAMAVYLIVWRPYTEKLLLVTEVGCHAAAMFLVIALSVALYGVWQMVMLLKAGWNSWHRRKQQLAAVRAAIAQHIPGWQQPPQQQAAAGLQDGNAEAVAAAAAAARKLISMSANDEIDGSTQFHANTFSGTSQQQQQQHQQQQQQPLGDVGSCGSSGDDGGCIIRAAGTVSSPCKLDGDQDFAVNMSATQPQQQQQQQQQQAHVGPLTELNVVTSLQEDQCDPPRRAPQ
ncbi:hypothetical protein PLESTB_001065500 [Pleodorina starrii]|uniref:Uncharacterized protein n=1 Tax=Pleodorina starrii TaxID=330485 RepID=A0A9W6BPL9_9CHLO|nr:hypothetical protein PLESTB_001065500 [Pleodorina starrii]GLC64096.1 hypothetical protein PLESTF_000117600 [Pleodorina starrii]